MCCDQYIYPVDNMHALARAIEGIRMMARDGVSEFIERAFTGFTALPSAIVTKYKKLWYLVLEVNEFATEEELKEAYHRLAKLKHPDSGGKHDEFVELQDAYNEGLKFIKEK